jgi:membrane dipeptidase
VVDPSPIPTPRSRARRLASILALASVLVLFFAYDPEPSFSPAPLDIEVSERARRLHEDAVVIDLHVDSLLWPRDLRVAGRGGQVDFPRMRAGGLDAAAFTVATAFFGVAGLKAFHDRWPPRTWLSPWARLDHQMAALAAFANAGAIEVTSDPDALRRQDGLYGFHGIEGAHALEGDVSRVRDVAARGVVFIGPVHLSDNAFGGSSSGTDRGLTELGERLVAAMNRAGVLVDLAHASSKTFAQSLALSELPPLVSHTGVRAVHDTWRNLDDDQIRAIAARGGVVGIMLAPPALAHASLDEALRHIEHVVAVGGEDVVALGSDFDGYVSPPIGADGLPALTELMLRRGFSEARIRKILGDNALRLLESRRLSR